MPRSMSLSDLRAVRRWNSDRGGEVDVSCRDIMMGVLLVLCVATMGIGLWFMVDSPASGAKRSDNLAPYVDAVRVRQPPPRTFRRAAQIIWLH